MAVVEFQQVDKRYGQVSAVVDLNLKCEEGEMLALLGPSGCGKSTTLKMAAGLEHVSSGEILFDSRAMTGLSSARRNIAMVFEDYCLYPNLTIEENVGFPLSVRRVSAAERKRRVNDVLAMLGLEAMAKQKVHNLSGGAQQRIAIGRAMIRDPDLVLFDEPLSHLDGDQRIYLRAEISRLQKSRGITSILVTHDQNEATAMADRIAIMHQGKLQQVATPAVLYARPGNVFVANFIGEPPMNLLPGTFNEASENIDVGIPDLTVKLASRRNQLLSRHKTPELIVGVRPEHILIATSTGQKPANAVIEYREPRGDVDTLALRTSGTEPQTLTAELRGPSSFRKGDAVHISFMTEQVHLFDHNSEINLELGR